MDGLRGITCLLKDRRAGPGQSLRDPLTTVSCQPDFPNLSFPENPQNYPARNPLRPLATPHSIPLGRVPQGQKGRVSNSSIYAAPIHSIASYLSYSSERTDRSLNIAYVKVKANDEALRGSMSVTMRAASHCRTAEVLDVDLRSRTGDRG